MKDRSKDRSKRRQHHSKDRSQQRPIKTKPASQQRQIKTKTASQQRQIATKTDQNDHSKNRSQQRQIKTKTASQQRQFKTKTASQQRHIAAKTDQNEHCITTKTVQNEDYITAKTNRSKDRSKRSQQRQIAVRIADRPNSTRPHTNSLTLRRQVARVIAAEDKELTFVSTTFLIASTCRHGASLACCRRQQLYGANLTRFCLASDVLQCCNLASTAARKKFTSVQLSSIQHGICGLGKDHRRSTTLSDISLALPLKQFPFLFVQIRIRFFTATR